jgi:hypothetical protein
MAQFRVEFVLDQASGKYLAEMYHPDRHDELIVRTEALYPSQAAAVLGVVQLFRNAILTFPSPDKPPRKLAKRSARRPARKTATRKAKSRKTPRSKKRKSRK